MPITPHYKSTQPKIGKATSETLKLGLHAAQQSNVQSVIQSAMIRAKNPKKPAKNENNLL